MVKRHPTISKFCLVSAVTIGYMLFYWGIWRIVPWDGNEMGWWVREIMQLSLGLYLLIFLEKRIGKRVVWTGLVLLCICLTLYTKQVSDPIISKVVNYFQCDNREASNPDSLSTHCKAYYAETYLNKSVYQERSGKLEEAIESCNTAIIYKADYAEAYYIKGACQGKLSRFEEAIESCNMAIKYKPDFAEAYYNKGVYQAKLDKHEEAIESYNAAIGYKPDYVEAYYNKGNELGILDKLEEAIKCWDMAIKYKSDYAESYANKGIALRMLGKHEEALRYCNIAIKYKPSLAEFCEKISK